MDSVLVQSEFSQLGRVSAKNIPHCLKISSHFSHRACGRDINWRGIERENRKVLEGLRKNTFMKLGGGKMMWGICAVITDRNSFLAQIKNKQTVNSQKMTEASLFWYPARSTSSCTICYQCFIVASGIIRQQSHCCSGKLVINDSGVKNKSLTDFSMSSQ